LSAAVFVKLLGAADYVEVRILIPPVGNGFGLKRAAVSAIFEGREGAPLLRDVTLHRVQNANAEFPTDNEERLAQQTLFPTSRLVGRDMHNTRFLLVVATAYNRVSEFSRHVHNRCTNEYLRPDSLLLCAEPWRLLLNLLLVPFQAVSGAVDNHHIGSGDDSGRRSGEALLGLKPYLETDSPHRCHALLHEKKA
jgi:hypothetical protein